MKIFSFLFLLLIFSPIYAQTSQQPKSCVNIANKLLECPSEAKMAETCKYYGYVADRPFTGSTKETVFSGPNCPLLECRIDTLKDTSRIIPLIRVETKDKKSSIEKTLKELGFTKEGKEYIKGSRHTKTRSIATVTSYNHSTTLTLSKRYN